MSDAAPVTVNGTCSGCHKPISENDGNLINFSGNLYHSGCFACSNCSSPIDYENSVVLMGENGKALCVNCSFKCKLCGQPILEEAITTGEETYHMACFRCSKCHRQIEDLTFFHVEDKLLCMPCHNESQSNGTTSENSAGSIPSEVKKESALEGENLNGSRIDLSGASSLADLRPLNHEEYILQLEHELEERSRQLTETEANLARIKNTSKRALEEFRRVNEGYQREILRRQQAEAAMESLGMELAKIAQADAKHQRSEENIERLNREVGSLLAQRTAIEQDIQQLSATKEELSLEVGRMVEDKHTPVLKQPAASDVEQHTDLEKELEQIKIRFRSEVSALQQERDNLRSEVQSFRTAKEELFNEISRLMEENKQLESRHQQISNKLIATADHFEGANSISTDELIRYPEIEELAKTVSMDDVDVRLPPLPPPRSGRHPLGPRKDSRGDAELAATPRREEPSDTNVTPPKKEKWSKDWKKTTKTTLKATKTKLRKAIPQGKMQQIGETTESGSGSSLLSYGTGMFKMGGKKPMSKSESDLTNINGSGAKGVSKGSHSFQLHSYRSPRKCDSCHDKLWGRELRCEGCGFHCHQKCAPNVVGQCVSGSVTDSNPTLSEAAPIVQVFGTDLSKLLELEGGEVPKVVTKCIATVEERGMDAEGIYRKSGPLSQVNKIIAGINKGEEIDLTSDESDIDIMAVTSVLKQYFRELPEPLLVSDIYPELMNIMKSMDDDERKMPQVVELLKKLPPAHFATLTHLMLHLDRVQQRSGENLMTPGNLGVVFGPSLLRPRQQETQLDMTESSAKNAAVEFLVRHANRLFSSTDVKMAESVPTEAPGTESKESEEASAQVVEANNDGVSDNKVFTTTLAPTQEEHVVS